MRGTLLVRLALAAVPVLGGCATARNIGSEGGTKVYGGTQVDAAIISESLSPDSRIVKSKRIEQPVRAYHACCGLIDLPLSFVADTALLPITVPLAMGRSGQEASATEEAATGEGSLDPDNYLERPSRSQRSYDPSLRRRGPGS